MQLIKWSGIKPDQKLVFFFPGKHLTEPTAWFVFKEDCSQPNNVLAQKEHHVLDESKCTQTHIFKASI